MIKTLKGKMTIEFSVTGEGASEEDLLSNEEINREFRDAVNEELKDLFDECRIIDFNFKIK